MFSPYLTSLDHMSSSSSSSVSSAAAPASAITEALLKKYVPEHKGAANADATAAPSTASASRKRYAVLNAHNSAVLEALVKRHAPERKADRLIDKLAAADRGAVENNTTLIVTDETQCAAVMEACKKAYPEGMTAALCAAVDALMKPSIGAGVLTGGVVVRAVRDDQMFKTTDVDILCSSDSAIGALAGNENKAKRDDICKILGIPGLTCTELDVSQYITVAQADYKDASAGVLRIQDDECKADVHIDILLYKPSAGRIGLMKTFLGEWCAVCASPDYFCALYPQAVLTGISNVYDIAWFVEVDEKTGTATIKGGGEAVRPLPEDLLARELGRIVKWRKRGLVFGRHSWPARVSLRLKAGCHYNTAEPLPLVGGAALLLENVRIDKGDDRHYAIDRERLFGPHA